MYFSKNLSRLEVKDFFISSFLFRSGLYDLKDLSIFGTSLLNPLENLDFELPVSIFRYHESKILKYTGLSFKDFMSKTKDEQDTIFNTVINLEILDKAHLNEIVDELEIEKG